ncbi:MAG: sulfatase-like hydrolase/transferase [Motiliproteus sp.]
MLKTADAVQQYRASRLKTAAATSLCYGLVALLSALHLQPTNVNFDTGTLAFEHSIITVAAFSISLICYQPRWLFGLFLCLWWILCSITLADPIALLFYDTHIPWRMLESAADIPALYSSVLALTPVTLFLSMIFSLLLTAGFLWLRLKNQRAGISLSLPEKTLLLVLLLPLLWQQQRANPQPWSEAPLLALLRFDTATTATPATERLNIRQLRFGHQSPSSPAELAAIGTISQPQAAKNLVLIVLESVGSQQLQEFLATDAGSRSTLAKLANQSVLFQQVYNRYPTSENANMRIQTGGIAPTLSDSGEFYQRPYAAITLARLLSKHNYGTALFSSQDQSFRSFRSFLQHSGFQQYFDYGLASAEFQQQHQLNSWGGEDLAVMNKVTDWLQTQTAAPFFLQYLSNAPHHPYSVPESFKKQAGLNDYQQALLYADQALGKLYEQLQKQGILENTLIAITGDHGDPFATRLLSNKGSGSRLSLDETTVKSFLLLSAPGQLQQPVISDRIGNQGDLLNTLSHAVLPDLSQTLPGQNLLAETHPSQIQYFHFNQPLSMGLRDGNWKYLLLRHNSSEQLFDLSKDPREQTNLAAEHGEQIALYRQLLNQWYLDADQEFMAQLQGSSQTTTIDYQDLSRPGAKNLTLGTIKESNREIIFTPQQSFGPQQAIVAQTQWSGQQQDIDCKIDWQPPSGKPLSKTVTIPAGSQTQRFYLPAPTPLALGHWATSVQCLGLADVSSGFEVADTLSSITPPASPPLLSIQIGENKKEGFTPTPQINGRDTFMVETIWFAEYRARTYQILLIDPDNSAIAFDIPLVPNWRQHYKTLSPPQALQAGLWQIWILDGEKILGRKSFRITP